MFVIMILFSSLIVSGCAEFFEDYSYGSGGLAAAQSDASSSGSRDPFSSYGAYSPSGY